VVLLEYFGQFNSEPCGACDVCTGEHESGISFADFTRISVKIRQHLLVENCSIDKLVRLVDEPEAGIVKVSRWLLDNGKVKTGQNGQLTFTGNGQ